MYSEFPEDKEFYQLRPEIQIRILIYLADNIIHHEVYKVRAIKLNNLKFCQTALI